MTVRRPLLNRVEALLLNLLDEAQTVTPAVVDADGIERVPAKPGATFGERLRLAEVAANFETRRAKVEESDPPPASELDKMVERFHGNANRAPVGRARRKAAESNGIANAGRVLPPYVRPSAAADPAE